ncbi:MAG TPA: hypothetical protein VKY90_12640 [Candidatus Dormibacteraeota bacterium]|nr:hypothetical protein [Candidatus Dormibacteraeota bacterium]
MRTLTQVPRPPKSVSVLWALAPPQLRFELEAMAAMAAGRAVMRMPREQPFVRETRGDPEGIGALDETGFLGRGGRQVGPRLETAWP